MLFISGGNEPEIYRNRKQYFSKNVQVVAGPSLEILDIVTGYAGSSHDQHVFNMSLISIRFGNEEFGDKLLLGLFIYLIMYLHKCCQGTSIKLMGT